MCNCNKNVQPQPAWVRPRQQVMYVDAEGTRQPAQVGRVQDLGSGQVELDGIGSVRYVNPNGARQYQPESWHLMTDRANG